jgi:phosphoglycerate dehydrogenase-like enzyme
MTRDPASTKFLLCIWHRFELWRPPEWFVQMLRTRWPAMKLVHLPTYEGLEREIADTHIFAGFSLRPQQFALAKELNWIHCLAAGVNQLMQPAIVASDVVITNSRGVHAVPMAEHTLGLILALARHLPSAARHQDQHHWSQSEIWAEQPRPMELGGRTLVIIGFGAIGRELAQRAKAFGMRIFAVKKRPDVEMEPADAVFETERLVEALAEGDFVVVATPETPETIGLINARMLAAMKRTAYLINVSRGTLVKTDDLIEALRSEQIAGAALDVTDPEPLPSDHPLWSAPRLFLTPHVSAISERLWHRHAALLLNNLERWFSGRELLNVVDKKRGY